MPALVRVFALTTSGLESICREEIQGLPNVAVTACRYRRVAATCAGIEALPHLLRLRTVDDVFVEVAQWTGLGRPKSTLDRIRHLATAMDIGPALETCAAVRPIGTAPPFAVTASFVGRRNYGVRDIEAAVADGIAQRTQLPYSPTDALASLSFRLFIDHDVVHVGLRLGSTPLHERPYRVCERIGALRPPVAAAMVNIASPDHGMLVLDPYCGTGTIPIEAARAGMVAIGSDVDRHALETAQANVAAAPIGPIGMFIADAGRLPIPTASIHRIVTNLPWGHSFSTEDDLATLYRHGLAEFVRVLVPGGRLVALTTRPDLLDSPRFRLIRCLPISLLGKRPTIVVLCTAS